MNAIVTLSGKYSVENVACSELQKSVLIMDVIFC